MRTLVINCSAPHYNLGAEKLADYLRATGEDVALTQGDPGPLFTLEGDYDRVCLSVIFSWDALIAREIALRVRPYSEVWAGGPGLFALQNWWKEQTGLVAHSGLDRRFDQQEGKYRMTFASRGCPVGCTFCIVPKLEGKTFTLNRSFQPAPILCDNNLSALPVEFQEYIIERYEKSGVVLEDANSGFEPRTFDEDTYQRWKPLLRGTRAWKPLRRAPLRRRWSPDATRRSKIRGRGTLMETLTLSTPPGGMVRHAAIDKSGLYRYNLVRLWDWTKPAICFCMLNPSTADSDSDDPTIRRCLGFARAWGYGRLEVVNLFAYRATRPIQLLEVPDPIGPENDYFIVQAVHHASRVIVAWGALGHYKQRNKTVIPLLGEVYCLGTTGSGQPSHPLYQPKEVQPILFQP